MMNEIAQEIGKEVKKAREERGLTQQELSSKVEMSRNYLSDIECGRYLPSVPKLLSLSNELNIDLNIFKNDGNTRRS